MCPLCLCVPLKYVLQQKKAMTTNCRHRQITPSIMKNQTNLVQQVLRLFHRLHRDYRNAHLFFLLIPCVRRKYGS